MPIMPTLPCVVNKCILYPSCINKETIYCRALYKCFRQFEKQGLSNQETWYIIHQYLKTQLIYPEDKPKGPHTTLLRSHKNPTHRYDTHIKCSK